MKTTKIIYWTTTILIVLFDGLIPALTSNTELARQGISHLQYPDYFRVMLTFFKVVGAMALDFTFYKRKVQRMGLCRFWNRFYLRSHFSLGCGWLWSDGYCAADCFCEY